MSVIDTLEVRLRADTSLITARLNALADRLERLRSGADTTLSGLERTARSSVRTQTNLAARLNVTARALKNVAANAKAAADGIGLHRLDEVNLVGEKKAAHTAVFIKQ